MEKEGFCFTVTSIFCGAGGMDAGFRDAGFRTTLAADHDPVALASFTRNFPSTIPKLVDLSRTFPSIFVEELLEHTPKPDGIIGGPPCQGFSIGNTKSQGSDPRNSLIVVFARIAAQLAMRTNLKFFAMENVSGVLARKHAATRKNFYYIAEEYFRVCTLRLRASDYGVAQSRERVFFIGFNRNLFPSPCVPTLPATKPPQTVRDVIGGLPEPAYYRRGDPCLSPFHPNHWTMNPKSHRFRTKRFHSNSRSFQQLAWDLPSRTIAYGNREIHVHPEGHRRLSILEAMLLQGFTVDFALSGNFSEQVTQVSNAVPPPLAAAVAQSIYSCLMGAAQMTTEAHSDGF